MAKSCYEKVTKTAQEENFSFFSVLFFQWMSIILKTGNERAIEKDDLLPLKEENATSFLSEKLQSSWNQETDSGKRYCKGPKLWKSVLKMISVKEAIIITLTGSLRTFSNILQPLLLGYLLESLRNAEQKHNYFVYICALGIGINELFAALNVHHFSFQCEMLGIKISGGLKGLVYNKVSTTSTLRYVNLLRAQYVISKSNVSSFVNDQCSVHLRVIKQCLPRPRLFWISQNPYQINVYYFPLCILRYVTADYRNC